MKIMFLKFSSAEWRRFCKSLCWRPLSFVFRSVFFPPKLEIKVIKTIFLTSTILFPRLYQFDRLSDHRTFQTCTVVCIMSTILLRHQGVNTLRPRENGRHFADDIFKCIFLNENVWIPINVSLKFVPKGPINNIPTLRQIMAWRRSGNKPLSEPVMLRLMTHICVARSQWVKLFFGHSLFSI